MRTFISRAAIYLGFPLPDWTKGDAEIMVNPYGATASRGTAVVADHANVDSAGATRYFALSAIGSVDPLPVGVLMNDIPAFGRGYVQWAGDCYVLLQAGGAAVVAGDRLTFLAAGATGKWRKAVYEERFAAVAKAAANPVADTLVRATLIGPSAGSIQLSGVVDAASFTAGTVPAASIVEKTATVAGLIAGSPIVVSPPTVPTPNGCQMVAARVSATDTLAVSFANTQAAGALAIPAGNYAWRAFK